MNTRPRIAIVGGGVSGLAAAYFLGHADERIRPEITLIEAESRLGGKIYTGRLAGVPVDTGPDAFLTRAPDLRDLLDRLGLAGSVVGPAATGSYVFVRGRLRPLPSGTVFGVPQRLLPLLRSGLLSPTGMVRAGLDLVLPRRRLPADPSVRELLQPRFGTQVYDRLIEPLLGGVHAGRAHLLSARSTVPEVEAVARDCRSVYLGLRRRSTGGTKATGPGTTGPKATGGTKATSPGTGKPAGTGATKPVGPGGPVLASLDGGLGTLVDALAAAIRPAEIRLGTTVVGLERSGTGYRLALAATPPGVPIGTPVSAPAGVEPGTPDGARQSHGEQVEVDAVLLATPAPGTAALLDRVAPQAADALRAVPYADVATVTLEYAPDAFAGRLDGTGFLVPPVEGRMIVGCTWLSAKWPYLARASGVLIRCAVGRFGDERWRDHSDDALVDAVHAEIAEILGGSARPRRALVQRWPDGLPQYTVGHADRLATIDTAIADVPGLHLAGAAYRGVGLAGCVAQARRAARATLAGFGAVPATTAQEGAPA